MTNRVQVKDKATADHDHRKHVNIATSCSRCAFFSNRFAEENTSHGRIGYAGRILSESIGSRDDVEEEKLSSCSIRAQNTDIHRLLVFVLAVIAGRLIRNSSESMASRQR
jgi:hypothetical protein